MNPSYVPAAINDSQDGNLHSETDHRPCKDYWATPAPLLSHGVLRAFVDAYRTVAETLILYGDDPIPEKAAFIEHCLKLGRQLQHRRGFLGRVSLQSLFETGLKLASHRDLHKSGQAQFREDFLHELKEMGDALDQILNLTLSQARQRQ